MGVGSVDSARCRHLFVARSVNRPSRFRSSGTPSRPPPPHHTSPPPRVSPNVSVRCSGFIRGVNDSHVKNIAATSGKLKQMNQNFTSFRSVPTDSLSRGGDVTVYVFDINQPSLPTPFFCSCVFFFFLFMALSTLFYSINSLDNSPVSDSNPPVLFLRHWHWAPSTN